MKNTSMEHKALTVRAIDNKGKLPKFFIKDQQELKEKFAPFQPQNRPWLVILEVNKTDSNLNTECTGIAVSVNLVILYFSP